MFIVNKRKTKSDVKQKQREASPLGESMNSEADSSPLAWMASDMVHRPIKPHLGLSYGGIKNKSVKLASFSYFWTMKSGKL